MFVIRVLGSSSGAGPAHCLRRTDLSCGFVTGSEEFIVLKGGQDPLIADSLGSENPSPEAILRHLDATPKAAGRLSVSLESGDARQPCIAICPRQLVAELDGKFERLAVERRGPLRVTCVEREVAEAMYR